MSSLSFKKNLKHDLRPFSTNFAYQIPVQIKFKRNSGPGRKKFFQTLWAYYKYLSFHFLIKSNLGGGFSNEEEIKKHVEDLAKRILKGERRFVC